MAANALNFGSKVVFLNGLPVTLPVLASNPGSAVAGDFFYNSTSQAVEYYNGSTWVSLGTGAGTVTSVSVVSANGLAGTVATSTTTPAITLSTTLNTPVIAGNGTALIAATTTGTGSTVVLS